MAHNKTQLDTLIEGLKSTDIHIAAESLSELRIRGWLEDGSLVGANLFMANLNEADLHGADLRETDLRLAVLDGATLFRAKLTKAHLNEASLNNADLCEVDLYGGDLSEASLIQSILTQADLSEARLYDADLSWASLRETRLLGTFFEETQVEGSNWTLATCGSTIFSKLDLSTVKGLSRVQHTEPSTLGIDTLRQSKGKIPRAFLRGCGVPESMIGFAKSIREQRTKKFTAPKIFVSYKSEDLNEFVQPLVSHLRRLGFNASIDQNFIQGSQNWLDRINEELDVSKYMILCVSPEALESQYVKIEYRYFLHEKKPILPVMCRPVRLPPELIGIQNVPYDFERVTETLRTIMRDDAPPKL